MITGAEVPQGVLWTSPKAPLFHLFLFYFYFLRHKTPELVIDDFIKIKINEEINLTTVTVNFFQTIDEA